MKPAYDLVAALVDNVASVIAGKTDIIRLVVTAMLARGHVLLEDMPGVGKTVLARALARSVDCAFKRIQCTPDLLPVDVTGYVDPRSREFVPGPVFAQIVLADELNRATPRTQSALLEAMGEGQVTVEGITRPLPDPFMVIATQNPIEHRGVNDLPEAQLDRFTLLLTPGYPEAAEEKRILQSRTTGDPLTNLRPLLDGRGLTALLTLVPTVRMTDPVIDYIIALVRATRDSNLLQSGASPRCALQLMRLVQAYALIQGRDYVIPDDVKELAIHALPHRVLPASASEEMSATQWKRQCVQHILAEVPPPDV